MADYPELKQKVVTLDKKLQTLEIAALATLIFIFLLNTFARL